MKRRWLLFSISLAATSFAEATVVKKNAKGAKELGGVYTLYTASLSFNAAENAKIAKGRAESKSL